MTYSLNEVRLVGYVTSEPKLVGERLYQIDVVLSKWNNRDKREDQQTVPVYYALQQDASAKRIERIKEGFPVAVKAEIFMGRNGMVLRASSVQIALAGQPREESSASDGGSSSNDDAPF